MNKLPKSILNYFATFTETRFNFRRLINYKWINDELTLDFSFFPQFQSKLLEKIKTGDISPVSVKQNEQTIIISKDQIVTEIHKILIKDLSSTYIDKCQTEEETNINDESNADPELFEKQKIATLYGQPFSI